MKTILFVLEGIADEPIETLDRKTPLEIAKIPNLKALAQTGSVGRLRLTGSKSAPSREKTCLSLLGYDSPDFHVARGPLSASAIDLKLTGDEWLLACRLVTTADGKLLDSWAGNIGDRESAALYEALNRLFKDLDMRIYTTDGRCHVLAVRTGENYTQLDELDLPGPDESLGREMWGAWSKSKAGTRLKTVLAEAAEILEAHEVNKVRVDLNENPANALWIWGAGKSLELEPFAVPGSAVVVSSSDIWKGAALAAGIEWAPALTSKKPEPVDLAELAGRLMNHAKSYDLVILHLDEADRAGMTGEFKKKIRWIEAFDQHLIGAAREQGMTGAEGVKLAVVSGHVSATDRRERTSSETPFLLWEAGNGSGSSASAEFTEEAGNRGAKTIGSGAEFLKKII